MKITIWGVVNMVVSLNMKMVNPRLNEFDVQMNFMRIYVGIGRVIGKTHFMRNISFGHFVSKSK